MDEKKAGRRALTDAACRAAKPGMVLADVPPHGGLRLEVAANGGKRWTYRYKTPDGRLRQAKIGHYPPVGLSEARKELLRLKDLRAKGDDPQRALRGERVAKAAEGAPPAERATLRTLVDDYIARHLSKRARPGEPARVLRKELPSDLLDRPAEDITRGDIARLLDSVKTRTPRIASQLRSELKLAYGRAIELGTIADNNPTLGTKAIKHTPRDRHLTDPELKTLLAWLKFGEDQPAELPVSRSARDALLVTLLTGCRSGEAVLMRWRDVDLEACLWTQPTSKTGVSHTVYLSEPVVALLRARKELTGTSPCVFPTPRNPARPINQRALVWELVQTDRGGLRTWTAHDLRRSCATGLARLRVDALVIDRVLNHVRGGAAAIYDRHRRDEEAREAWAQWAQHLAALSQNNVVPVVFDKKAG